MDSTMEPLQIGTLSPAVTRRIAVEILRARHGFGLDDIDLLVWLVEPSAVELWAQGIALAYHSTEDVAREMVRAEDGWGITVMRRVKFDEGPLGEDPEVRGMREGVRDLIADTEGRFLERYSGQTAPPYLLFVQVDITGRTVVWVHPLATPAEPVDVAAPAPRANGRM